jgi:hypothetical protein
MNNYIFLCNNCINELAKFKKYMKKFAHVLSILLHLYIKFQDQYHYNLAITKNRIFVFLLVFHLYEFDLKILCINRVGSK